MEEHKHCNICEKVITLDRDICEDCIKKIVEEENELI